MTESKRRFDPGKLSDPAYVRHIQSLEAQQIRTLNKKREFLLAYEKTMGNISKACDCAGIKSRKTFYNWCATDPEFKEAVSLTGRMQHDLIQDLLHMRIIKGDLLAIKFFLSRKHPDYMQKRSVVPPKHTEDVWKKWEKLPWPEDKEGDEESV